MINGLLVGFPFPGAVLPISTVGGEGSSTSQDPDPHQSMSFTPMPTDFPMHSDGMDPSDNPDDDVAPSDTAAGDNVGLLVAVMVGGLLLVLAVVGVPLIVIMVIKMRKKGKQRTLDVSPTDGSCSGEYA